MKTVISANYIESATMDYDKIRSVYVITLTMLSGKEVKIEFTDEKKANKEFDSIMFSIKKPISYGNTGKQ